MGWSARNPAREIGITGGQRPNASIAVNDLILRDRSTANNGTINERRYAMQDGNWNAIAICDITGFVGERYAYSAYGTPVFMTGAVIGMPEFTPYVFFGAKF